MHKINKSLLLGTLFIILVSIFMVIPTIPQPLVYMHFADTRTCFGIPDFGDVVSNGLFAVLGIIGLVRPSHYATTFEMRMYQIFYISVLLVTLGSSYFHWSPSFWSLLWDRLPIAIAMMSFLTAMIGERYSEKWAKVCWLPLLALGIFSVCYWYYTEIQGVGDLRLYLFTLLFPIIFIPALLLLFPQPRTAYLWMALISYVFARITEYFDHEIYALTHTVISGHTVKHLLMALGILFIYLYKRRSC